MYSAKLSIQWNYGSRFFHLHLTFFCIEQGLEKGYRITPGFLQWALLCNNTKSRQMKNIYCQYQKYATFDWSFVSLPARASHAKKARQAVLPSSNIIVCKYFASKYQTHCLQISTSAGLANGFPDFTRKTPDTEHNSFGLLPSPTFFLNWPSCTGISSARSQINQLINISMHSACFDAKVVFMYIYK